MEQAHSIQETLYEMIFKRKSFHLFRNTGAERLSDGELEDIQTFWRTLTPLCPDIKTAMRIVPEKAVTNQRGQEYCLAFYSERKGNYLQNIGYLGQLMDLYLVSRNIGTCWFGIGKAKEAAYQGLDYVVMIALRKVDDPKKFRKDMFKAKRKPLEEIWQGESIEGVSNIARFAPSACNSQPWRVERSGGILNIFRYRKPGKIGIMSPAHAKYFNRIDMGIYLCILELCLKHQNISSTITLHPDFGSDGERTLSAVVQITENTAAHPVYDA